MRRQEYFDVSRSLMGVVPIGEHETETLAGPVVEDKNENMMKS